MAAVHAYALGFLAEAMFFAGRHFGKRTRRSRRNSSDIRPGSIPPGGMAQPGGSPSHEPLLSRFVRWRGSDESRKASRSVRTVY